MTDLKFVEPDDIPSEFSAYDKKVEQLDVGKTGKVGFLRIKLEKDSKKIKLSLLINILNFHFTPKRHFIMMSFFLAWLICLSCHHQVESYKETGIE